MRLAVLIPAIERDLPVLGPAIEGVRRNLMHDVAEIVVVGPRSPLLIETCAMHEARFVDEASVLGITPADMSLSVAGVDRSGWLFQQLVKLSADTITQSDAILVLDADTVLLRPQRFFAFGRPIFRVSDELHPPYRAAIATLLGLKRLPLRSFVAHHMLFEHPVLERLRSTLAERWSVPWHEAIRAAVIPEEISGFSEYETYGAFHDHVGRPALIDYWDNRNASYAELADNAELEQRFASCAATLSFHHYRA